MQEIISEKNIKLVRFDPGEEVFTLLLDYLGKHNFKSCSFSIIGACQEVILAYYNLDNKKYLYKIFRENLEIISVSGNTAKFKGENIIHAHGVFARPDYSTIGGHIKSLTISATAEVTIFPISSTLQRIYDSRTGLNLLAKYE